MVTKGEVERDFSSYAPGSRPYTVTAELLGSDEASDGLPGMQGNRNQIIANILYGGCVIKGFDPSASGAGSVTITAGIGLIWDTALSEFVVLETTSPIIVTGCTAGQTVYLQATSGVVSGDKASGPGPANSLYICAYINATDVVDVRRSRYIETSAGVGMIGPITIGGFNWSEKFKILSADGAEVFKTDTDEGRAVAKSLRIVDPDATPPHPLLDINTRIIVSGKRTLAECLALVTSGTPAIILLTEDSAGTTITKPNITIIGSGGEITSRVDVSSSATSVSMQNLKISHTSPSQLDKNTVKVDAVDFSAFGCEFVLNGYGGNAFSDPGSPLGLFGDRCKIVGCKAVASVSTIACGIQISNSDHCVVSSCVIEVDSGVFAIGIFCSGEDNAVSNCTLRVTSTTAGDVYGFLLYGDRHAISNMTMALAGGLLHHGYHIQSANDCSICGGTTNGSPEVYLNSGTGNRFWDYTVVT